MVGKIGVRTKVDKRGRITLPVKFRELLDMHPGKEVIIEVDEGEERLVVSRPLSKEEFLKEAEELKNLIKKTKTREIDALKVKEIWERKGK